MAIYLDPATKAGLQPPPDPTPQPVPQGFQGAPQSPYGASYDEGYQPASQPAPLTQPTPGGFETGFLNDLSQGAQRMGQFGNYFPIGQQGQQAVNDWVGQQGPVGEAINALPGWALGGGELGALRGGLGIAGQIIAEHGANALPDNTPYVGAIRAVAPFGGGAIGAGLPDIAPRLAAPIDAALNPAVMPRDLYGAAPGTDSLFTAGPNGEVVGPTGNVAEMRFGRGPVIGPLDATGRPTMLEPSHDWITQTNFGRAQQANLAADEQGAFQTAYERSIAGANPPETTPQMGGAPTEATQGVSPLTRRALGPQDVSRSLNELVAGPVYHETSPEAAAQLISGTPNGGIGGSQPIFVSNDPTLALGQGGKGALIEFEPTAFTDSSVDLSKPSSRFALQNGSAEIIARPRNPAEVANGIRRVTVTNGDENLAYYLRSKGWAETTAPDGGVVFSRPNAIRGGAATPPAQPSMTPDDFASLAAKRARGEALTPEEQDRAMNALGQSMGALPTSEQAAARTAFYNAPENLGGGVGTTPEQLANMQGTVQRAGQLNTITDALANARAADASGGTPSALDQIIAKNPDELPAPTRTVPQNLAEIQARARRIANGEPPIGGGANIPGSQPPLVPQTGVPLPPRGGVEPAIGGMGARSNVTPEQAFRGPADWQAAGIDAAGGADAFGPIGSMEAAASMRGIGRTVGETIPNPPPAAPGPVANALGKAASVAEEAFNLPRTILTEFSLHGPLRNGIWLATSHPGDTGTAIVDQMRGLIGHADEVDAGLKALPTAGLADEAGLYRAPISSTRGASLSAGEEAVMSHLTDRIPVLSNMKDAYVTYLNSLRAHVFDSVASKWLTDPTKTMNDYRELAKFVNVFSGRGSLDLPVLRSIDPALLNATFFAPRAMAAAFQRPTLLWSSSPAVRMEAAKAISSTVVTGMGILGMMQASGIASVEVDPRSPDFGKYTIGRIHGDFWAGEQQIARLVANLLTGEKKSTTSGKVQPFGRGDAVGEFLRGRLNPPVGGLNDLRLGEDAGFNKVNLNTPAGASQFAQNTSGVTMVQVGGHSVPVPGIFPHELIEAINAEGIKGGIIALPSIYGEGVTTYDAPKASPAKTKSLVPQVVPRQRPLTLPPIKMPRR